MRRTLTKVVVLTMTMLMILGTTGALAASVIPSVIPGGTNTDKTCAQVFPGTKELKIDQEPSGTITRSDGYLEVTVVAPSSLGGANSFDFTANKYVLGVIVKDGVDGANVYDYRPDGSLGDTLLTTPYAGAKAISHVSFCYTPSEDYESLDVTKTVNTSYTREHFWDIAKKVETDEGYEHEGYPKVWLFTDGSGDETATWTVDVTYEGYEDSAFNVAGEITIENTGTLDAVITSVEDVLASALIEVDCGAVEFPYTLLVGETLTCTYDEDVDSKIEGSNVATVTTERDSYTATEPIVWGDPTTEINKTVNVKDISDLFGEVDLGTVTAPDNAQFTYTKDFAYEDYGQDLCGDYTYGNTASIVETDQEADATLKVNVQCMIFKGETVTGAGLPWSAVKGAPATWFEYTPIPVDIGRTYTTDLIQGAPRNDVGDVTITIIGGGEAKLCFDLGEFPEGTQWMLDDSMEYNVKIQPLAKKPTKYLQPGQFSQKFTETGSEFCVTVPYGAYGYAIHLDAGYWMPDPNFGPM
jgi:hypothetical protein